MSDYRLELTVLLMNESIFETETINPDSVEGNEETCIDYEQVCGFLHCGSY